MKKHHQLKNGGSLRRLSQHSADNNYWLLSRERKRQSKARGRRTTLAFRIELTWASSPLQKNWNEKERFCPQSTSDVAEFFYLCQSPSEEHVASVRTADARWLRNPVNRDLYSYRFQQPPDQCRRLLYVDGGEYIRRYSSKSQSEGQSHLCGAGKSVIQSFLWTHDGWTGTPWMTFPFKWLVFIAAYFITKSVAADRHLKHSHKCDYWFE